MRGPGLNDQVRGYSPDACLTTQVLKEGRCGAVIPPACGRWQGRGAENREAGREEPRGGLGVAVTKAGIPGLPVAQLGSKGHKLTTDRPAGHGRLGRGLRGPR